MGENGLPEAEKQIIVEVDPDLEDLIPIFLENRKRDVETLTNALAEADLEKIRTVGHDMKGAGGGYGFHGISDIGSRLEMAAKNGDQAAVRAAIGELSDYLLRVKVTVG